MLGSPAGHAGGNTQRGLWPLAPAPAPPASHISSEGYSRYGVYSLFPGAGSPAPGVGVGAALYSHTASTIGRFGPGQPANPGQASATTFHTAHKVTDSLYSTSNYTFGAPTPPPGSPYSPVPVAQLELLAKGISSSVASHVQNTSSNLLQIKKTISLDEKCVSQCEDRCWSTIKSEKRTSCNCPSSPLVKTKFADTNSGCSRTNPVDWSSSGGISVKREPGSGVGAGTTPCQVAEVTTSDGTTASAMSMVKVEVGSPTISNKTEVQVTIPQSITNGNIPIGIAVARQRLQQDLPQSPNLGPSGLLTPINHNQSLKDLSRLSELDTSSAGMAAAATGGGSIGGTLLQCADDRGAGLAAWPMGGTHGSALTTPTLWQYPAPMPLEPMLPMPIPMPPVGFQLIRDPASGHFLLIPTATLEQLQQAVVWPSYPQPSSHVLLPPLPPPPLAPLQLLSSASSDYLATSTTLHQHTQTHSTRLVAVTTDTKRKMTPLPTHHHTLIKIEADCTQSATSIDNNTKHSVSTTNTGSTTTMYDTPVTPLLTTHLFYQHPTNLILSNQTECKSQATSPVTCLTPPPEQSVHDEDSVTLFSVQDASNQTETHIFQDEEILDEPSDLSMKPAIKTDFTAVLPIKDQVINVPETETVDEIETKCVPADTSAEIVEEKVTKPDISGLELLSNSIVEFENNRQSAEASPIKYELKNENEETAIESNEDVLNGIAHMTLKDRETDAISTTQVDDTLGGLGLLCALAEQRFMEEVDQQDKKEIKTKREKKLKRTYDQQQQQLDSKTKRFKTSDEDLNEHEIRENELELERERLNVLKRVTDERGLAEKTTKRDLSYELGVVSECDKRYKTDKYRQDDCSCKREDNENRKYTNNNNTCNNNNNNNNNNKQSRDWSLRQQIADLQRQYKEKKLELSKLNPEQPNQKCPELKKIKPLKKLKERSLSPPVLDKIEDIPIVRQNLLKPPTLCAVVPSPEDDIKPIEITHKRKSSISQDSCDSTPEKISSSKKRKVGRPKKLMSAHGLGVATETIVAKKPRSKSSLVGYLLAAKKHLQMQNKSEAIFAKTNSPIRYVEEKATCNSPPTLAQHKKTKAAHKASKIRPKLKAETKIKTYTEDEEDSQVSEWEIASQSCATKEAIEEPPTVKDTRCILTAEHLEIDKLRVLTAMGGLFYAGQLTAIQAPDVYAITLDGERGNRPHIMSREEILRDAIVEVSPKSTTELSPGTRLCAYWSQQYRCLYPGTVAEPGTPNPQLDLKFICVEFDDGDSGTIALEDIRLLPVDYPIIEYDPNPLLSLSKRRRRTSVNSVTEERHLNNKQTASSALITVDAKPITTTPLAEKENTDINRQTTEQPDTHRERKRLKKRRKDKMKRLMCHDDKKKKRKHRSCEEHCKHRKHHKKHRKHKKHHHNRPEETVEVPEPVPVEEPQTIIENDEDEEEENIVPEIIENKPKKSKKREERRESGESRSKMAAFLPARQLWGWSGRGYKRVGGKGRARKQFFKAIQRGKESIMVGDCAVFLSTGRPDRPYIGKIEAMWETWGTNMVVRVKWFYHPEETVGCPPNLKYPGALFESPHVDENDVQTISHKCEVLPLKQYTDRLGPEPQRYETIYDNNDIYYLAGYYDPTVTALTMEPEIPLADD